MWTPDLTIEAKECEQFPLLLKHGKCPNDAVYVLSIKWLAQCDNPVLLIVVPIFAFRRLQNILYVIAPRTWNRHRETIASSLNA